MSTTPGGQLLKALAKRKSGKDTTRCSSRSATNIGIAAFLEPVVQKICRPGSKSHAPSPAGREKQAVLQGLSIPKRISLEFNQALIKQSQLID